MRLRDLTAALADRALPFETRGDDAVDISGVTHRSSDVTDGSLFAAIPGSRVDGHDLVDQVVAFGAAAVVVERPLDTDVAQVIVPSTRMALGPMTARFHGDPSHDLVVIGVTGTNGKTTTVAMLRAVFAAAGRRTEMLGTLTSAVGGPPTTPDAPDLQAQLARWRDEGVEVVAMEVSSHALAMGRVDGTRFAMAGFTTLGHDHLDHHGDLEHYFAAKARLFRPDLSAHAVIRGDDAWGAPLAAETTIPVRTFSLADAAPIEATPTGVRFSWRGTSVDLPLVGDHNVANALCAASIASWLDVDDEAIAVGLGGVGIIDGRFELVDGGQSFTVAVDYAHTPDALATVLVAARGRAEAAGGKVIVVFGCGGNKDRAKRPEMGRIAAESADVVVVTSDNPRSENPSAIIDEILAGVGAVDNVAAIVDRRDAIHHAVAVAENDDVVHAILLVNFMQHLMFHILQLAFLVLQNCVQLSLLKTLFLHLQCIFYVLLSYAFIISPD